MYTATGSRGYKNDSYIHRVNFAQRNLHLPIPKKLTRSCFTIAIDSFETHLSLDSLMTELLIQ